VSVTTSLAWADVPPGARGGRAIGVAWATVFMLLDRGASPAGAALGRSLNQRARSSTLVDLVAFADLASIRGASTLDGPSPSSLPRPDSRPTRPLALTIENRELSFSGTRPFASEQPASRAGSIAHAQGLELGGDHAAGRDLGGLRTSCGACSRCPLAALRARSSVCG